MQWLSYVQGIIEAARRLLNPVWGVERGEGKRQASWKTQLRLKSSSHPTPAPLSFPLVSGHKYGWPFWNEFPSSLKIWRLNMSKPNEGSLALRPSKRFRDCCVVTSTQTEWWNNQFLKYFYFFKAKTRKKEEEGEKREGKKKEIEQSPRRKELEMFLCAENLSSIKVSVHPDQNLQSLSP